MPVLGKHDDLVQESRFQGDRQRLRPGAPPAKNQSRRSSATAPAPEALRPAHATSAHGTHRVARLSSPTWVEAGVPQPGATAENTTSSPPKAIATLTEEDASRLPLYPYGMRASAATYTSFVSTNMSAYEDLPGHQLLSVRNLIASTPDSSYPNSTDEGFVPVHNHVTPEWDYSGICDLGAFL